jgi:hypothetical protein
MFCLIEFNSLTSITLIPLSSLLSSYSWVALVSLLLSPTDFYFHMPKGNSLLYPGLLLMLCSLINTVKPLAGMDGGMKIT